MRRNPQRVGRVIVFSVETDYAYHILSGGWTLADIAEPNRSGGFPQRVDPPSPAGAGAAPRQEPLGPAALRRGDGSVAQLQRHRARVSPGG